MRLPSRPDRGPRGRNHPLGRTCQSHAITVDSPWPVKVKLPEASIIEPVVREPSRRGRAYSVDSTGISGPGGPILARNRVPGPTGSGVRDSTDVIDGLNNGSFRESATVSKTCSIGAAMDK